MATIECGGFVLHVWKTCSVCIFNRHLRAIEPARAPVYWDVVVHEAQSEPPAYDDDHVVRALCVRGWGSGERDDDHREGHPRDSDYCHRQSLSYRNIATVSPARHRDESTWKTYETTKSERAGCPLLPSQEASRDRDRERHVLAGYPEAEYRGVGAWSGEGEQPKQERDECGGPYCVHGRRRVLVDAIDSPGEGQAFVASEREDLAGRGGEL